MTIGSAIENATARGALFEVSGARGAAVQATECRGNCSKILGFEQQVIVIGEHAPSDGLRKRCGAREQEFVCKCIHAVGGASEMWGVLVTSGGKVKSGGSIVLPVRWTVPGAPGTLSAREQFCTLGLTQRAPLIHDGLSS